MAPSSENERPPAGIGRWQFGLASILAFTVVCALALGLYRSLGPGTSVFVIGFAALMLLALHLMTHPPRSELVVLDVNSDAAAHAACEHLRARGIAARVVTEMGGQALPVMSRSPQIVVPGDQARRAQELLAELGDYGV